MEVYDCIIQHWQKSNTNKREIRENNQDRRPKIDNLITI